MAVEYSIRVEGLKKLQRALSRAPGVVRKHLRRAMDRSVKVVQRKAQVYPPAPPLSSYVRTGTLGRRWRSTVEVAGMGVSVRGILENPTPYAPYVQGDETQAAVHRGLWKPIGKIVKETEREMVGYFEKGVADAVREIEGKG